MIMKHLIPFMLACVIAVNVSYASTPNNEEPPTPRAIFAIQPLYLLSNGLRLDYDRKINKNHWIQISPILFFSHNTSEKQLSGDRYDKQQGAGLHLYHRFYPAKGFAQSQYYISYGPMWHFHDISYQEPNQPEAESLSTSIHKFGADVIIGYHSLSTDNIFIDLYTGLGFRFTDISTSSDNPRNFNQNYWGPGYSGNILILGMRIGFATSRKP